MWMFAFVEEHSLADLPAKFQPVTIADGAYLVKEGDACDRLVLLVRGQLHEMKSGVEGSKRWEVRPLPPPAVILPNPPAHG